MGPLGVVPLDPARDLPPRLPLEPLRADLLLYLVERTDLLELALAAVMASRSEQSPSQTPSWVSPAKLTVRVEPSAVVNENSAE